MTAEQAAEAREEARLDRAYWDRDRDDDWDDEPDLDD